MSGWGKSSFIIFLATIILAASPTAALTSYDDGLRYFDEKDYAAAFKEWQDAEKAQEAAWAEDRVSDIEFRHARDVDDGDSNFPF